MPLWWSGSPPAFSFTKVSNRCFLWGISVFHNIRRKKEMNEEWRKLSVTACVHRSCFYYDRKVYSEWFAILSQVKTCLGEEYLPFAKRAFNFQIKDSSFIMGGMGGGRVEEEKCGKSDLKESSGSCFRLECWGQCVGSHLPKGNLVHYFSIRGKVFRKLHMERK